MAMIEIPQLFPTFNNLYSGGHWTKRKKMKDEMADIIGKYILYAKLRKLRTPISITTDQFCRGHIRDFDSGAFATKVFADTLVGMGILPDDNPDFISGCYLKASIKSKENKTIFNIQEYDF